MEAKDKAIELIEKFAPFANDDYYVSKDNTKQCALICVDEIITALNEQRTFTGHKIHLERFYEDVKKEIEKL